MHDGEQYIERDGAGLPAAGLREREARLAALFDNTVALLAILATDGTVLDVNRAALAAGGMHSTAVLGRPFWDAGWWTGAQAEQDGIRGAVLRAAAGELVESQTELKTGSDLRTIAFTINPVRGADGTVAYLVAEGRDVTDERRADQALRLSEARLAGMISIASDAIISIDGLHRITLFNQGAEAIFGYAASEVMGKPLDILLPERLRRVHAQHLTNFATSPVAARRMGERQEILGRRKDGTEFAAEASISKMNLDSRMIFTVVLRDITERKRTERAQRFLAQAGAILASSLEYETTLASVAGLTVPELADWCVVFVREMDGRVRRLEVAHADPAHRSTLQDLLQFPLDPRSADPVFAVLATGRPEIIAEISAEHMRALAPDEQQRQVYEMLGLGSMLVVPLVARGETRGAMGFYSERPHRYGTDDVALAQDLALLAALAVDNARLYRDAQSAIQARDDLIAVVSHDLGNPLSAIRIGTSLLLRTVPQAEQETGGWKHLEFIRQSAEQMERLINDLLDVKRLEAGRVTLQVREFEIGDVVREVADVFEPIARGRTIALELTLPDSLPSVAADPRRISQVLSNLIGNAIKFTEAGGTVRLSARSTSDALVITVSDTGRGIAREHIAHVFDRFWQAQRTGKQGLGLGLAIARGIVEAHGGRIWVESTLGVGSTFFVSLPMTT